MEIISVKSNDVLSKMPFLKKKIIDNFGDKGVSLYSLRDNDELFFVIMCTGNGLLINSDGENLKFKKGFTGMLGRLEKNGYIITPKCEIDMGDDAITNIEASITDSNGIISSITIMPSYGEMYQNRVCYTQYNKENDLYCEVNYDYVASSGKIYPGLLRRIDSVQFVSDFEKKGMRCNFGFVPNRIKMYSRSEIDAETINYSFVSFNEHGLINTLLNGSYNLYGGAGHLVRFVKLGFMNMDHQMVEMPWPLSDYKKEEDLLKMIENYGFNKTIPSELITIYNDEDRDINLLQEFLSNLDEYKNNSDFRKYVCFKK